MFGRGKIQMLQSQLNDANDKLDRLTREKTDLEQKLASAASRISELESRLADSELEQLKEEVRTSQAEYEGLKDLYTRKFKEFNDTREEKEQEFAREAAVERHNLEKEIHGSRQSNQDYMSGAVKHFTESYNYYLNQIKLLMDALGDVAAHTGETLFAEPREDLKVSMGQEMAAKLQTATASLRSEESGLVLIASAKDAENQSKPEIEGFASEETAADAAEMAANATEAAADTAEAAAGEAKKAAEADAKTEAAVNNIEADSTKS